MACYHPMRGYRSKYVNPSGKRSIVFKPTDALIDMPVELPCGQCIGCRLEKSRQWAIRCVNEAQLYPQNCFITLTFNEANLEKQKSLVKSDFQKFIKRLRKHTPGKVRYFHCGEYGELLSRPHHHAIIFNYDFPDKQIHTIRKGSPVFRSTLLEKLWTAGFSEIGDVTFESAAYVARYTLKKQTGQKGVNAYKTVIPPYNTMSLKPGIGEKWLTRYLTDVYPSDEVLIRNNIRCKPPKYYDQQLDRHNPHQLLQVKKRRHAAAKANAENNTPERLAVREELKLIQTKELTRGYENEE